MSAAQWKQKATKKIKDISKTTQFRSDISVYVRDVHDLSRSCDVYLVFSAFLWWYFATFKLRKEYSFHKSVVSNLSAAVFIVSHNFLESKQLMRSLYEEYVSLALLISKNIAGVSVVGLFNAFCALFCNTGMYDLVSNAIQWIIVKYTSSNHRLGSAGLNALEELLFRCWQ